MHASTIHHCTDQAPVALVNVAFSGGGELHNPGIWLFVTAILCLLGTLTGAPALVLESARKEENLGGDLSMRSNVSVLILIAGVGKGGGVRIESEKERNMRRNGGLSTE